MLQTVVNPAFFQVFLHHHSRDLGSLVPCQVGVTMGCIKSKEEKGSTMKYCPENSMMADPNSTPAASQMGHYGPDPTQLQNQVPSSSSTITPFGGSSSAMTPFGGVSSSFTGPVSNSFSGAVSSEFPT